MFVWPSDPYSILIHNKAHVSYTNIPKSCSGFQRLPFVSTKSMHKSSSLRGWHSSAILDFLEDWELNRRLWDKQILVPGRHTRGDKSQLGSQLVLSKIHVLRDLKLVPACHTGIQTGRLELKVEVLGLTPKTHSCELFVGQVPVTKLKSNNRSVWLTRQTPIIPYELGRPIEFNETKKKTIGNSVIRKSKTALNNLAEKAKVLLCWFQFPECYF